MSIQGVDVAWAQPTIAQIKASGAQFIARYLSPDKTKNLTSDELKDYKAASLETVVVWESVNGRMKDGYAAGVEDAKSADAQRKALGLPDDMPIYFACDFDATGPEFHTINEYMRGVNSVIGLARSGFYGGYYAVENVYAAPRRAQYYWQTAAWSSGHWSTHANIRQTGGTTLSGQADRDIAETADYGQYPRPVTVVTKPAPPAAPKGTAVNLSDQITLPDWAKTTWPDDKGVSDGKMSVENALAGAYAHSRRTDDAVTALTAAVAALTTTVAAMAAKNGA